MKKRNHFKIVMTVLLLASFLTLGVTCNLFASDTEETKLSGDEAEAVESNAEQVASESEIDDAEEAVDKAAEDEMSEAEEVDAETAEAEMSEVEEGDAETAEAEMSEAEEVDAETAEAEMSEAEEVDAENAEAEMSEQVAEEPEPFVGKQEFGDQITGTFEVIDLLSESLGELLKRAKLDDDDGAKSVSDYLGTFSDNALKAETQVSGLLSMYAEFKTNMGDHFSAWETEISSINNEKLRKTAEKRLAAGMETFSELQEEMGESENLTKGFISDLQDVTKYLSFDATQSGVEEISSTLEELIEQGGEIKEKMEDVPTILNDLPELFDEEAS